jgi:hypothetical protein
VIGGYHSGKLEEAYNKAAMQIAQGAIRTADDIAKAIKELYLSDTDFKNDFATIALNTRRNKKLIRYILFELENQLNNSGAGYDFEENPATIEHILPENASVEWESFFPKNRMENYVFRIGNYTLLEAGKNNALGNKSYEEKLIVYKTSLFKSTSAIDYPEWNANNLDIRQITLAKMATSIWKLPYY